MKLTVTQFIQLWAACDGSLVKFNSAVNTYLKLQAEETELKTKKENK